MQCKDVQTELLTDSADRAMADAVRAHVASCPSCRQVYTVLAGVQSVLQQGRPWQPPHGFGRQVAARAHTPVRLRPAGFFAGAGVRAVVAGTATALAATLLPTLVDGLVRRVDAMGTGSIGDLERVAWTCAMLFSLGVWIATRLVVRGPILQRS